MPIYKTLIPVSLLVAGCSFNPPPEYYTAQQARNEAIAIIAAKPLLEITGNFACPESECAIRVYDPNAAKSVARIEEGTTSAKVAVSAIGGFTDLLKFGIGGIVAVKSIKAISDDNGVQINNSGAGNVDLASGSSSIVGTDVSDSGIFGDSTNSADSNDTTNTSSLNTDDNTNNSDNSDNTNNSDNSTQPAAAVAP